MAKAMVKCKNCGKSFDRNSEPFIMPSSKRYAHLVCPEKTEEEKKEDTEYSELEEYIKKLFNIDTLSIKIKKQIKNFKEEYDYSYSGIQKTLFWWFELKGNSIDKTYGGIGIVPYVYNDAYNYFYRLYLANTANTLCDLEKIKNIKIKEIEIASPRTRIDSLKLLNFEE